MNDFYAYQHIVATAHAEAKERARWRRCAGAQADPSAMTEADCIAADLHNDIDKSSKAHTAQTLNAVRLEFKHAQQGVAA